MAQVDAGNRMPQERPLVVFSLDEHRYALALDCVQRVIRVVAITTLPEGPSIVLGVVDLAGEITVVVDLRRRFNAPHRDIRLSDHLIVAATRRRQVALLVDEALGVIGTLPGSVSERDEILPGLELVDGVVKLEDGLILIHDLERLLSLEEEAAIDRALDDDGAQ